MILISQDGLLILNIDNISCIKAEVSGIFKYGYKADGTYFKEDCYSAPGYEVVAQSNGERHALGQYMSAEQVIGIFEHLAESWDTEGIFRMPDDEGDWE